MKLLVIAILIVRAIVKRFLESFETGSDIPVEVIFNDNGYNSRMEFIIEWDSKEKEEQIQNTIRGLTSVEGIKEVCFKDGAIVVEAVLPSAVVGNTIEKLSGRRAVLQGYGDSLSAVAMVSGCGTQVVGVVRFQQSSDGTGLVVDGTIDGLSAGAHGLHVHQTGDLSEGCLSLGGHFDMSGGLARHGAPGNAETERHAGDLGNIVADESGRANFRIVDNVLKVWDIVGRSIAVTDRADDLGLGKDDKSRKDGNSGESIACGVIARSAGLFQNPKRLCACDGVPVWDERDKPMAGSGRRSEEDSCCKKSAISDIKKCCQSKKVENNSKDFAKTQCCL